MNALIKKLISMVNAVAALLIGSGWEALGGTSASCTGFRFLGLTLIIMGVVVLTLSCAGIVVPKLAEVTNVCCSLPLNLVVTALGIFALAVSSSGYGKSIPGRSYKEYHVEWYSKWMQHKVNDTRNWETYYRKSIIEADVCNKFSKEYEFDTLDAIRTRKLSPFESSCCMPPEDCGFNYTSPTVWVKPENGNYTNRDCNRWDNGPDTLCYDCETCKAGFLQDVTSHYFKSGIALLLPVAQEIFSFLCCSCIFCTTFGIGKISGFTAFENSYSLV